MLGYNTSAPTGLHTFKTLFCVCLGDYSLLEKLFGQTSNNKAQMDLKAQVLAKANIPTNPERVSRCKLERVFLPLYSSPFTARVKMYVSCTVRQCCRVVACERLPASLKQKKKGSDCILIDRKIFPEFVTFSHFSSKKSLRKPFQRLEVDVPPPPPPESSP